MFLYNSFPKIKDKPATNCLESKHYPNNKTNALKNIHRPNSYDTTMHNLLELVGDAQRNLS